MRKLCVRIAVAPRRIDYGVPALELYCIAVAVLR